jgi:hypothetical protein
MEAVGLLLPKQLVRTGFHQKLSPRGTSSKMYIFAKNTPGAFGSNTTSYILFKREF